MVLRPVGEGEIVLDDGLQGGIPRPGAGDFALGGKVTKTPPAPFGPDSPPLSNTLPDEELLCPVNEQLVFWQNLLVQLRLTAS